MSTNVIYADLCIMLAGANKDAHPGALSRAKISAAMRAPGR